MNPDGLAVRSVESAEGELLIRTGVAGPAAAVGHRLTIAMRSWRVTTRWNADEPVDAELTVDVGGLDVVRGEGGVTPLSGPEKFVVRRNALSSLEAKEYPRIMFSANTIEQISAGYRLSGDLTIHGTTRPHVVEVCADDRGHHWQLSGESVITQSDFGVKPYSQLLGAIKVADDVTVSFAARAPKTPDEGT